MAISRGILLLTLLLTPGIVTAQSLPLTDTQAPTDESTLHVGAEWILWWLRQGSIPPILTTGSPSSQGILGHPDTQIVYGDDRLKTRHEDRFNGIRFNVDWLNSSGDWGVEGRAFFLERDSTYFKIFNEGSQLLALSYIDAQSGQQASRIISGPDPQRGLLAGGFVGYSRIELFGEEFNLVAPLIRNEAVRLDLLAGARFLQMRDRYHHTATSLGPPDRSILYGVVDNYRIANAFYGGQLGARGEAWLDRFFLQARATIALGGDAQRVQTFGLTTFQTPQQKTTTPVGLHIQSGNSGDFSRGQFDGVAEVGANAGYQFTQRFRAFVGYTFLCWFDPLRAGDQIDPVVDTRPGAAHPTIPYRGDFFWAQGVNAGLEFRW